MIEMSTVYTNTADWYLIHCQPRREEIAAHVLRNMLGLCVYLPECKVRIRGNIQHVPFFPGYIFARVDFQKVSLSKINTSPGVLRLVEFGGEPQPVPSDVISEIAERLQHMEVRGEQILRAGDCVRIKRRSSLQGLEMIFVGPSIPSQRVFVLLNFLGRVNKVSVDIETLEKVPAGADDQTTDRHVDSSKKRYTRGKGRKIKY